LLSVFDDLMDDDNFDKNIGLNLMPTVDHKWATIRVFPNELKMLDKALRSSDGPEWAEAHDYEISRFTQMGVWEIVKVPEGKKAIPYSEPFRDKRGSEGNVKVQRARIVVGGHKQIEGIDYGETLSAVAKMSSVQAVLWNVAIHDWEIHQVDIQVLI
jgi:hypothetical protein